MWGIIRNDHLLANHRLSPNIALILGLYHDPLSHVFEVDFF